MAKKPTTKKPAARKTTARKPQKKTSAKGMSAGSILSATKSFVMARVLAYIIILVLMLAAAVAGVWIIAALLVKGWAVPALIIFIVIFCGLFGLLRFARRYFLYMIKAAHVAAITEYIKTGAVPVTESGYKGVMAYGTEKIKRNFKEANIAFVADALIAGATRQIMRWVNKVERLFSFIPGANMVMSFVNLILSTALNYVDEAVLSYVFYHNEERNGFKKACDGLVYYAQSWKGMLKGAFKVAAFVWILRIVTFIIFCVLFIPLGQSLLSSTLAANICALVLALIIMYGVEAIIVVPYATCVMINDYYKAIKGQRLRSDLHGTLCKVSKKFRSLFEKSGRSRG
ncbi:MAG: hypothetical protein FWF55_04585 [Treponema sp.]|nr:hypothetical protein [Treponema sp.]